MSKLRSRKAFTIVEMVIVIAVIAILAVAIIPTVSAVIQKANVSADTQFAASLNVQLAMWEVEKGVIKNESDLRNAINNYYGEFDEDGNLITDFYASLAPKSGKHGYHYWYDVENRQIVLSTYDKLAGTEVAFNFFGVAFADDVVDNEENDDVITFSPASLRSLAINGKNYFLIDQEGSANSVVALLKAIEGISGNGEYGVALANLEATQDDNGLAGKLASKLKTTAIGNSFGVFFYSDWGTATQVHVPYGVTTLGSSKVEEGKFNVAEIYLPDTITLIGTGSLLGFTLVEDNGVYEGSTTIYINATAEQVTGGLVATDAFDCVLEIPTGDRFAFVNGVLTNLKTKETVETEYSVEIKSFKVSCGTSQDKKFDLHPWDDGTYTFHYTADITEDVILSAKDFIDENDEATNRTAVWKVGEEEVTGNTITLRKEQLFENSEIKVVAQNLEYTIELVKVAIGSFTANIEEIVGAEPFNPNGDAFVDYYTATLSYRADSSWTVGADVSLNPVLNCVVMSNEVELSLSGAGAEYLVIDGNSIKINSENVPTGTFEAVITIKTKGVGQDGQNISTEYRITFNKASTVFDVADNADVEKYGIKLTVGTIQPITLETLFKVVEGTPENITVHLDSGAGTSLTDIVIDKSSGSDWKKWTITPSSAGNFRIVISDGGKECPLSVSVESGAYNVANLEQWKSAGSKIVLLKDIELGDNFDTQNKTLTYMQGNMHVIDASQFNYDSDSHNNCYLIKMTSGTFNSTVILGPVYPEAVLSGDSEKEDGYFAPGLRLSGTVIVNNSYISGFFAPIRVDGGTITIKNTTLDGGINSNIHIYNGTSVTLQNSVTIQRRGGYTETYTGENKKVIGSGIFCDTAANGTEIILKDNTQQYNWVCDNDSWADPVKTIIDTVFTYKDCDGNVVAEDYFHTIDGKKYINMGVAQEKKDYTVTSEYTGDSNFKAVLVKYNGILGFGAKDFNIWSYKSCGSSCTHDLNPKDLTNDGIYTYLDFIASRKVN